MDGVPAIIIVMPIINKLTEVGGINPETPEQLSRSFFGELLTGLLPAQDRTHAERLEAKRLLVLRGIADVGTTAGEPSEEYRASCNSTPAPICDGREPIRVDSPEPAFEGGIPARELLQGVLKESCNKLVEEGVIEIGPLCHRFRISWQRIQPAERRRLPVAWADDDWDDVGVAGLMALHGLLHLHGVTVIRGEESRADKEKDKVGGFELSTDRPVDVLSGVRCSMRPCLFSMASAFLES